jgi:hypothetical protein
MRTLSQLLLEQQEATYRGFVRVTYSDEMTATELAEILRAFPGVTIVSTSGSMEQGNVSTYKVKVRSTSDDGESVFTSLRKQAIRYPGIIKFEIATNTIERLR